MRGSEPIFICRSVLTIMRESYMIAISMDMLTISGSNEKECVDIDMQECVDGDEE